LNIILGVDVFGVEVIELFADGQDLLLDHFLVATFLTLAIVGHSYWQGTPFAVAVVAEIACTGVLAGALIGAGGVRGTR